MNAFVLANDNHIAVGLRMQTAARVVGNVILSVSRRIPRKGTARLRFEEKKEPIFARNIYIMHKKSTLSNRFLPSGGDVSTTLTLRSTWHFFCKMSTRKRTVIVSSNLHCLGNVDSNSKKTSNGGAPTKAANTSIWKINFLQVRLPKASATPKTYFVPRP